MGVDLTLLPYYLISSNNLSLSVLGTDRDYELYDRIKELDMLDVADDFYSYVSRNEGKESHFGLTIKDCYGEKVKYTTVKELLKVNIATPVFSYKNEAVWAYLAKCPPNLKVALFWH